MDGMRGYPKAVANGLLLMAEMNNFKRFVPRLCILLSLLPCKLRKMRIPIVINDTLFAMKDNHDEKLSLMLMTVISFDNGSAILILLDITPKGPQRKILHRQFSSRRSGSLTPAPITFPYPLGGEILPKKSYQENFHVIQSGFSLRNPFYGDARCQMYVDC